MIYLALVREFYANFCLKNDKMVYSKVQGLPIAFKVNLLAHICSLSDSGVRPFMTHHAFMDISRLQYEDQLKTILVENFVASSVKPLVSELSPLGLLLFKLFLSNVLLRKSGRDRVTFQDSVLISVFIRKIPCKSCFSCH